MIKHHADSCGARHFIQLHKSLTIDDHLCCSYLALPQIKSNGSDVGWSGYIDFRFCVGNLSVDELRIYAEDVALYMEYCSRCNE